MGRISSFNKNLFLPCHTGCLDAIWIGSRRWGSVDVSWAESLNSSNIEGRTSRKEWLLTAEYRQLPRWWHSLDLGQLRYSGGSYLKVLQQLFDLTKSEWRGAALEAAASPVRTWPPSLCPLRPRWCWGAVHLAGFRMSREPLTWGGLGQGSQEGV